jgi:hypothetical protein
MAQSATAQRKRKQSGQQDDATRRSSAASGRKQSSAAKGGQGAPAHDGHGGDGQHAAGLAHHTAHASLPIPYLTPADMAATARSAASHLPAAVPDRLPSGVKSQLSALPSREQMAFYGGLGALAVAGAVEWPVALAIGAATAVARGGRHEDRPEPARKGTSGRTS